MRQLSKAIRTILTADPTISSSATGVFYRLAPQNTPSPYIIYQKILGEDVWTFESRAMIDFVYLVKAISETGANGMGKMELVDYLMGEVDRVLSDTSAIVVPGYTVSAIRRTRQFEYDAAYADIQIKYDYIQAGEVVAHSGANYNISLVPD